MLFITRCTGWILKKRTIYCTLYRIDPQKLAIYYILFWMDPQQRAIYYTLYRMDTKQTCYLLHFVQDGSSKNVLETTNAQQFQKSENWEKCRIYSPLTPFKGPYLPLRRGF